MRKYIYYKKKIKKIKHENCEDLSSLHHRWVVFACLSVNCLRLWQHTDRHEHLHQETHGQRFFFFFSFPIRYRFLSHLIIIIQIASRLGCVRFRSIEFSCFGLTILLFRAEALRDSKRQMTNATRGSVVFQSIS